MKDKKILKNLILITGMILLAALTRLFPHPPNFTPLAGMALFGAALFRRSWIPYLLVFGAYFLSDFVLNNVFFRQYYPETKGLIWFTGGWIYIYGAMALILLLGQLFLNNLSWSKLGIASILSGVLFYAISNFGVWAHPGSIYPTNVEGLLACYVAGLPFLSWTILGNLFFTFILFGAYSWFTNASWNLQKF